MGDPESGVRVKVPVKVSLEKLRLASKLAKPATV